MPNKTQIGNTRMVRRQTLTALALALLLPRSWAAEPPPKKTFNFSIAEVSPSLVHIEYSTDGGVIRKGNGVIVQMDGKPYLLTNQHIVLGAENMRFITASGDRVVPTGIELSDTQDLARLALEEGAALSFSTTATMDAAIALFKVGLEKGPKEELGKVIGIGGGTIEISAEFEDANNGSPALNEQMEVVGIASYSRKFSKSAMKIGTRFENGTRYFCCRIDNTSWKTVNWRSYNKKYGSEYQRHKTFSDEVYNILMKRADFHVQSKKAAELATECRTHARQINLLREQRDLTGFMVNDLEEQLELFEYAEQFFSDYAK